MRFHSTLGYTWVIVAAKSGAMTMHFAYQGFTHDRDTRCFRFRGIEELSPPIDFSIEIDMPLLSRTHVPVQDGPTFCLQLLVAAAFGGPGFLERFRHYRVIESDFRPLLVERARQAAEKAMREPPRQPARKPSSVSNVHLGKAFKEY
jgi:hypothetical protein